MPSVSRPASPTPLVIDTDPGIDDALAILLALASPELDVRAITVTYGNTVLEHAHRNAVALLRRAGRRLTVGVSARRPSRRPLAVALETHGESGLGYAALPPAGSVLDYAKSLERILAEQPAPVTLLTLGPVTGLARALRREPDLVRAKVARHVAMIGSMEAPGNTTPHSEFNAWCDPEALDTVLRAELPSELIGLDVTNGLRLTPEDVRALADGDPDGRFLHDALRFYLEFHRQYDKLDACIVHDVLAVAALVDPVVATFSPLRLAVRLVDGDERGRTLVDPDGARARVALAADSARARALLLARVLEPVRRAGLRPGGGVAAA